MNTAIATIRPGLLGRTVFDDIFGNAFFNEFPAHLRQSTQGYPVADIYQDDDGSTILEFALAGFSREDLSVDIQPDKSSITVTADTGDDETLESSRRIARRSFKKTYINYDRNLELDNTSAEFNNGLLTVTVPVRAEMKPTTIKIL